MGINIRESSIPSISRCEGCEYESSLDFTNYVTDPAGYIFSIFLDSEMFPSSTNIVMQIIIHVEYEDHSEILHLDNTVSSLIHLEEALSVQLSLADKDFRSAD